MLLLDVDLHSISVYRIDLGGKKISSKKTYLCSLPEVIREYKYEQDHHVLLPEYGYIFHTIKMEYASDTPLTIAVYKQLLQEKKELLVREYACDPLYMSIIPYIHSELGERAVRHILGKSGHLSWTWYLYAITPDMLLTLRQAYGNELANMVFAPRNLATIYSFSALLQRSSFTLLTLGDQYASLCQVQDGRYNQVAHAPLGLHVLFEATEDQGVQKYLFRGYEELQRNSVAQRLLLDSLGFYASALADWVGNFFIEGSPLIVCCSLVAHELFCEVIQSTLQEKGAFVLPFAGMPTVNGQKISSKIDFCASAYIQGLSVT